LIDVWRAINPDTEAYIWGTAAKGSKEGKRKSRIDLIHVREDWLSQVAETEIMASGVLTDHKCVSITLRRPKDTNRSPGR